MGFYLEATDEKLAIQMTNFGSKIGGYATIFALTPAEVSSIQADAAFFSWSVGSWKRIDTYKQNWTSFKTILKKGEANVTVNTVPVAPVLETAPAVVAPGIVSRFTTVVNRIKAHQAYTTAIGANLGIEGSLTAKPNADVAQPTLKAVMRGGKVNLIWRKAGFSGIVIEKDSGAGFVVIDKDFSPDFIDNSPMPAAGESTVWKYRASYLLGDEKVGLMSDIVSISVAG
jgi:hypothetical protein